MMKAKYFSIGLVAASLIVATSAYAGIVLSGAVSVKEVDVETDPTGTAAGTIYVKFNSAPFTTSCSANTSGTDFWALGGNSDSVKALQALALAAKLSGKQVKVLFNNTYSGTIACTGGSTTGSPIIRGLSVQ